tara:strand:+ start:550 stop:957 length:408 start_codon:yes stop_codon:yes gene_type:complete
MATHTRNNQPSTKIVISDGSSVEVETINVGKEIPKDVFASYIPRTFDLSLDSFEQNADTLFWELTFLQPLDVAFLMHVRLLIDGVSILRKDSVSFLQGDQDQFAINSDGTKLIVTSSLHDMLQAMTEITITYTPI